MRARMRDRRCHLGCSLGRPRPIIVFWPFHWLYAPFPPILFSWGAPSIMVFNYGVFEYVVYVVYVRLISRVKDGEPVDWRYDLGEYVYVIIKTPQLRIHIRKYFVPNGEWTLHPTKRGVTLSLNEWKKNWKRPYLYVKTESQNWGQWTIKWLEKIKWKRLRNRTWT